MLSSLMDIIFDENPNASSLMIVTSVLALVWFLIFQLVPPIVGSYVRDKKWLHAAVRRDYEQMKKVYDRIGYDMGGEEATIAHMIKKWPRFALTSVQHAVGGLLCLPAVLGILDVRTSAALVCLGTLSEAGFEIQDTLYRIYVRTTHPKGKALQSNRGFMALAVHHVLATGFGIPMILHYRNLHAFHVMVFMMQGAAGLAGVVAEYTKLLDVTQKSKLYEFTVLTCLTCGVMVWTRGIHFCYSAVQILAAWWADGSYTFLALGVPALLAFGAFNYFFCIVPYVQRAVKFVRKCWETPTTGSTAAGSTTQDKTSEHRHAHAPAQTQATAQPRQRQPTRG